MRPLLCLVLLFAALPVQADSDAEMTLTVKPVLCITDRRTPECEMSFLVIWQSATSGYYCLYNDLTETPIRCWNERREGEVQDERTVRESFSYWMTDEIERVAEVAVEVLYMDSDDRRRRRRTRHVWDIN